MQKICFYAEKAQNKTAWKTKPPYTLYSELTSKKYPTSLTHRIINGASGKSFSAQDKSPVPEATASAHPSPADIRYQGGIPLCAQCRHLLYFGFIKYLCSFRKLSSLMACSILHASSSAVISLTPASMSCSVKN